MRHVRYPSEPKTASRATRLFFEAMEHSGVPRPLIAQRAGIHVNNFYGWKNGKISATVINMEAALAVLGLEFCLRPIGSREDPYPASFESTPFRESYPYVLFAELETGGAD